MDIHIGQLIREQVEKQGRTVVWLANELSYSRTNIYKIYDRASIDVEVLLRISAALDYDFFRIYSSCIEEKRK